MLTDAVWRVSKKGTLVMLPFSLTRRTSSAPGKSEWSRYTSTNGAVVQELNGFAEAFFFYQRQDWEQ